MTDTLNPARLYVRDAFKTLTGWNVLAEARPPEAVTTPTAVVWTGEVARLDAGGGQIVQSTVDLWLFPVQTGTPAALEDRADAMLTAAVDLIEHTEGLFWSTAKRAVMEGTPFSGWHLTLTLSHTLTTS